MKVGLVTCRVLPEPDVDEPIILAALADAGIDAELVAWDNPEEDWSRFDACVVRSTWNYYEFTAEFLEWIDRVDGLTLLANPADVMRENIDKRYLLDLADRGVAIVPTAIFDVNADVESVDVFNGSAVVIKPVTSAGSWRTRRFMPHEFAEGLEFLHENLKERAMMVQQFMPSVEQRGEVAWCWIDGEVTHGVRKAARFDDGYEEVSEAVFPTDEDRQMLDRIIQQAPKGLMYARIDLIQHEGEWLLSELELIEPSLFFKQNPAATSRLVQAIQNRMSART